MWCKGRRFSDREGFGIATFVSEKKTDNKGKKEVKDTIKLWKKMKKVYICSLYLSQASDLALLVGYVA